MPETGLEPVLPCGKKILSLSCIPISPLRQGGQVKSEGAPPKNGSAPGFGAKDRVRTGDLDLGKVALYQLSYFREKKANIPGGVLLVQR